MDRPPSIALLCLACLTACATPDDYPSLAIRDAERGRVPSATDGNGDTGQPEPLLQDVRDRLLTLSERARAAHQRFVAARPSATRTVRAARGAAIDTDIRASAEIALASLDSTRSDTGAALAELDELVAERSNALQPTEEIEAVRSNVLLLVRQEDEVLAELAAVLR